jgi:hypothetical protein
MKQKAYASVAYQLTEMGKVIQRLSSELAETKKLVAALLLAAHTHPDMQKSETPNETDNKTAI